MESRARLFMATMLALLLATAVAFNMPAARKRDDARATKSDSAGVATPGGRLPGNPSLQLVLVAAGLAEPVDVAAPDDGSGRLFVAERFGRIRVVTAGGAMLDAPFLDLTGQIQSSYMEQGLLGLAFHPDYLTNGRVFVAFTDFRTNGDTVIMEFHVSAESPNVADPASGRLLLAVDQPFVEHNGGTIRFGPDGYLYIGMGDGGHGGDPYDNAQDRGSLLGKLLRIDVDNTQGQPYGIPGDNPYAGTGRTDSPFAAAATPAPGRAREIRRPGRPQIPPATLSESAFSDQVRPEIWAYGLRHPWQFSFDPASGDLYIPDVGERRWEEINVEPAGSAGGANYGWDWLEGSHCYPENVSRCPRQQIGALPVAEYEHGADSCAIVGIGVYRGNVSPSLDGIYFNADFCSGTIWGLERGGDGSWIYEPLLDTSLRINGAGQDVVGELYLAASGEPVGPYVDPFASPSGTLWRLVAAGDVPDGAALAPLDTAEAEMIKSGPSENATSTP